MTNSRLGLANAIIVRDHQVLLLHKKHPARIVPHGGKIEKGETSEHAVVRECLEEIGVPVRVVKKLCSCDSLSPSGVPLHCDFFVCHIVSGEPHIHEPHVFDQLLWCSADELDGMATGEKMVDSLVMNLDEIKAILQ
ncbi:NUDIX domain-containing protein [Candidatus Woesearchaeota archaeon]|nr:NUDIX domain-containing protein [Candidatus Woesearchaeota archaeon]